MLIEEETRKQYEARKRTIEEKKTLENYIPPHSKSLTIYPTSLDSTKKKITTK